MEGAEGPITLTSREFDLLYHMAGRARQVFSREQLLDAIWDLEFTGDPSTVTVHMRRLRAKLEVDPSRPRHLQDRLGRGLQVRAVRRRR